MRAATSERFTSGRGGNSAAALFAGDFERLRLVKGMLLALAVCAHYATDLRGSKPCANNEWRLARTRGGPSGPRRRARDRRAQKKSRPMKRIANPAPSPPTR